MTVSEFIKKVNENNYYSLAECEIKLVYNYPIVCSKLNVKQENFGIIWTDVIKLDDGYVGIRGIGTSLNGNKCKDLKYKTTATKYNKITSTEYVSVLSSPKKYNLYKVDFYMEGSPKISYYFKSTSVNLEDEIFKYYDEIYDDYVNIYSNIPTALKYIIYPINCINE